MESLTAKEERFAQEYVSDLNATQAAIRAGYSENPASAAVQGARLLRNAKVKGRVAELQADAAAAARVTAEYVLSRLMESVERAMQRVPVKDRKGKQIGVWRFDSSGATRALEMLGNHLGMWKRNGDADAESRNAMNAETMGQMYLHMVNATVGPGYTLKPDSVGE